MAKLQHPHILRCYGGNLEGNNPFIVTELCECSLDKVSRKHTCWQCCQMDCRMRHQIVTRAPGWCTAVLTVDRFGMADANILVVWYRMQQ
jgi:hypothetical protein